MNLEEARIAVEGVEKDLCGRVYVVAHTFERNGHKLHLALTHRLQKRCKKGGVWKSKAFLTAFKNGARGFDPSHAHSPGGSDGIFVLTRKHRPVNTMMTKIFDHFLDKPASGVNEILQTLGTDTDGVVPVRLVSHHMRLLGLLCRHSGGDRLVLVDYDDTK